MLKLSVNLLFIILSPITMLKVVYLRASLSTTIPFKIRHEINRFHRTNTTTELRITYRIPDSYPQMPCFGFKPISTNEWVEPSPLAGRDGVGSNENHSHKTELFQSKPTVTFSRAMLHNLKYADQSPSSVLISEL